LFDLDNTLFDRAGVFLTWATDFVRRVGANQSDVDWFCEMDQDGLGNKEELWAEAKGRFGLHEPVAYLIEKYKAEYRSLVSPDDLVTDVLAQLRATGWRVGIVTNGATDAQLEKIRRMDLANLVDGVCVSGEIGVKKPDARIFYEVLRRCGCDDLSTEEVWMIGDSPSADVAGARALGFRTIWLDRGRRWNQGDGESPDAVASSLSDAALVLFRTPQSLR
jgi:putative hydrolase of the HAD superfamily